MGGRMDSRRELFHHPFNGGSSARSIDDFVDEEGQQERSDNPGHRFGWCMAYLYRPYGVGACRL